MIDADLAWLCFSILNSRQFLFLTFVIEGDGRCVPQNQSPQSGELNMQMTYCRLRF